MTFVTDFTFHGLNFYSFIKIFILYSDCKNKYEKYYKKRIKKEIKKSKVG